MPVATYGATRQVCQSKIRKSCSWILHAVIWAVFERRLIGRDPMKPAILLPIASLLSILLLMLHVTDDIATTTEIQ